MGEGSKHHGRGIRDRREWEAELGAGIGDLGFGIGEGNHEDGLDGAAIIQHFYIHIYIYIRVLVLNGGEHGIWSYLKEDFLRIRT